MLYLEDFLELIEQLPGELRDRSTEMRMLDLQAQQLHEQANKERDEFFETGGNLSQEDKIRRYNEISDLYARAQALTDEKVAIADIMHSLLTKYSQKLNKEIMHFKLELEADNPGITEQIEKKFNDTERNLWLQRKERRRKYREATASIAAMMNGNSGVPSETSNPCSSRALRAVGEIAEGAVEMSQQQVQQSGGRSTVSTAGIHDDMVTAATAAAAAAATAGASSGSTGSRARSTVSERDPDLPPLKVIVKRSLVNPTKVIAISNAHSSPAISCQLTSGPTVERDEAWNGTINPTPSTSSQVQFSLHPSRSTSSFAGPLSVPHSAPGPSLMSFAVHESRHGRPRKLTSRAQEMLNTMHRQERRATSQHSHSPISVEGSEEDSDSDKRVWCFCRDKAYGLMVACDDKTCRYEWFHYECVNVTEKPKGKWYCPECLPKRVLHEMPGSNKM